MSFAKFVKGKLSPQTAGNLKYVYAWLISNALFSFLSSIGLYLVVFAYYLKKQEDDRTLIDLTVK